LDVCYDLFEYLTTWQGGKKMKRYTIPLGRILEIPIGLYPTWLTKEDLVAYAKECCLVRELTPEEREVFGLPPR